MRVRERDAEACQPSRSPNQSKVAYHDYVSDVSKSVTISTVQLFPHLALHNDPIQGRLVQIYTIHVPQTRHRCLVLERRQLGPSPRIDQFSLDRTVPRPPSSGYSPHIIKSGGTNKASVSSDRENGHHLITVAGYSSHCPSSIASVVPRHWRLRSAAHFVPDKHCALHHPALCRLPPPSSTIRIPAIRHLG
jgi:hypothetical protein